MQCVALVLGFTFGPAFGTDSVGRSERGGLRTLRANLHIGKHFMSVRRVSVMCSEKRDWEPKPRSELRWLGGRCTSGMDFAFPVWLQALVLPIPPPALSMKPNFCHLGDHTQEEEKVSKTKEETSDTSGPGTAHKLTI